jgi:hypothetical protein
MKWKDWGKAVGRFLDTGDRSWGKNGLASFSPHYRQLCRLGSRYESDNRGDQSSGGGARQIQNQVKDNDF